MKTSEFEYGLPESFIAQNPPKERGSTRLLVMDRFTGELEHKNYSDISEYIKKGDVIVLNETKVMKARIRAQVVRTGRDVEVLFLNRLLGGEGQVWYCLVGRARHVKVGDILEVEKHTLRIVDRKEGEKGFRIEVPDAITIMENYGTVPLPPYIDRQATKDDEVRYNTVFSKELGSVAAPTASLNLTDSMIERIEGKGGQICYVELQVGLGTFQPVQSEKIEDHVMHEEYISVSEEATNVINSCSGRVWAFGTTVVRTLESVADDDGFVRHYSGTTDLFIRPGYEFKVVDVLVTNFHMPRSSLLLLVSAFTERKSLLRAYEVAKKERYQFLSYGDSMLIGNFSVEST